MLQQSAINFELNEDWAQSTDPSEICYEKRFENSLVGLRESLGDFIDD